MSYSYHLRKVSFFVAFCILLLSGCYTEKMASNSIDKARIKYPAISAQKCGEWYPAKTLQIITDSAKYKEWISKIDSFGYQLVTHYDTIYSHDTIKLNNKTHEIITKYQNFIKQMPPVHDTIKILDVAQIEAIKAQLKAKEKDLTDSYNLMNKTLIIGLILLLILFIIAILKK